MNPVVRLAVFGSLKKGFFNHGILKDCPKVDEGTVRGAMYLCYSYPHLYREEAKLDPALYRDHGVEIYEVPQNTFQRIEAMERGAGYNTHIKVINGQPAYIFFTDDNARSHEHLPWLESFTKDL